MQNMAPGNHWKPYLMLTSSTQKLFTLELYTLELCISFERTII